MRAIATLLVLISMSIVALPSGALAQEGMGDGAEEAIRAVVKAYETTWNANDMTAWGALFTDDVDYVHRGGGRWSSNEENIEGHRRIHERLVAENQPMNLQLTIEDIAGLSPSIALVHVTSRWPGLTLPDGSDGELGAIMTMVMVQRGGDWRIRAFHNTLMTHPDP